MFTFGESSCCFFHTCPALGPSPTCMCNFLLRWIPPQRPVGERPHLLWGGAPPFLTPKEPSCACADRVVFLDLRSGHLISLLQQSSASAPTFVLGVSGGEQSFSFTPLDKHQLSSPGAHLSPTSISYIWGPSDCFEELMKTRDSPFPLPNI